MSAKFGPAGNAESFPYKSSVDAPKWLREIGLDVPECAKLAAVLREKGFEVPQEAYSQADLLAAVLKNIGKDVE